MGRKSKSKTQTIEMGPAGDESRVPAAPPAGPLATIEAAPLRVPSQIEMWPCHRLVAHPQNPRGIDKTSEKFRDLVESIRANGILEPLTVREYQPTETDLQTASQTGIGARFLRTATEVRFLQILRGHRRWLAAIECGLPNVPVRNFGVISDQSAYDILAIDPREDLTPLEEGKLVSVWLDQYGQDARAIAGKLGRTEHWVLLRAQIERNLIPAWRQAIQQNPHWKLEKWSAAHWALIARLPAALQQKHLARIGTAAGGYMDTTRISVGELDDWLRTDTLYLAKAPFPWETWCNDCTQRTDGISQLLWADPDLPAEEGSALRCLDPKCWEQQCARGIKEKYSLQRDQLIAGEGITGDANRAAIVPISTIEVPKDYYDRREYGEKVRDLKRAFGKNLVEADRYTMANKGEQGAVPGIVVAGKGKGAVKWIRIIEQAKPAAGTRAGRATPREPTAEEIEADLEAKRWHEVAEAFKDHLQHRPVPSADVILLMMVFFEYDSLWGEDLTKLVACVRKALRKYPDQPIKCVGESFWYNILDVFLFVGTVGETLEILGPVLGFDPKREYERVKASEIDLPSTPVDQHQPPPKKKRGRPPKPKPTNESFAEDAVPNL